MAHIVRLLITYAAILQLMSIVAMLWHCYLVVLVPSRAVRLSKLPPCSHQVRHAVRHGGWDRRLCGSNRHQHVLGQVVQPGPRSASVPSSQGRALQRG